MKFLGRDRDRVKFPLAECFSNAVNLRTETA